MTEHEAITELRRRAYRTTCYGNKVVEQREKQLLTKRHKQSL